MPVYWKEKRLPPRLTRSSGGSFKRKEPPEIRGVGYAVYSLEAALSTFDESVSFEEDVSWQ